MRANDRLHVKATATYKVDAHGIESNRMYIHTVQKLRAGEDMYVRSISVILGLRVLRMHAVASTTVFLEMLRAHSSARSEWAMEWHAVDA